MGFHHRVAGLTIGHKLRNLDIQDEFRVKLLFLCSGRSQLRSYDHLVRISPGCFPVDLFWKCPTGRRYAYIQYPYILSLGMPQDCPGVAVGQEIKHLVNKF